MTCPYCVYSGNGWWRCDGGEWRRFDWMHRPWWKVAANTVLRFFQRRGPGYKWVITTKADMPDGVAPPITRGYGFGKVWHS